MPALRDVKREKFAQALFENLAVGMKAAKAADLAAETAGYGGSSRAANARKRAKRADVKKRMAELAQPALEKAQKRIEATLDWTLERLTAIAGPDLGEEAIKVSDQIAALQLVARIQGYLAPERREITMVPDERSAAELKEELLREIAALFPDVIPAGLLPEGLVDVTLVELLREGVA